MTNPRDVAENLGRFWGWINGETEMVTAALEAYGREQFEAGVRSVAGAFRDNEMGHTGHCTSNCGCPFAKATKELDSNG